MEILPNAVCVCACLNGSVCVSRSICAISIPSLGWPQKCLSWKSPAVDVIVLWLFPYLGRFNIPFYCLACQQFWPRYLPFPVIQECSGPFEPKHSLCLYHQPCETRCLLMHLRIVLKQITFNRQGQVTMKIFVPCVPLYSRWWCWMILAGLVLKYFVEPILYRWSGCYWMYIWPAKCVDWKIEPTASGNTKHRQTRFCWGLPQHSLALLLQLRMLCQHKKIVHWE